jgi:hypothetical protein
MQATLSRAAIEKLPTPHQVFTKEIPSIHDENATERQSARIRSQGNCIFVVFVIFIAVICLAP